MYSMRVSQHTGEQVGLMGYISLAMSWSSLGMGLSKVTLLKDIIPYRNKQKKKVKELAGDGTELKDEAKAAIIMEG